MAYHVVVDDHVHDLAPVSSVVLEHGYPYYFRGRDLPA
jgi:hypothetical protein